MLITLWAFSVSLFVSMLLSVCVAYFEFTKSPQPKGHRLNNPLCANGIFSGYVSLGSEAWSECFIWFWNCELLLLPFFRLHALLHLESQKSFFYLISCFPESRYLSVNWPVLLYLGFAMQRARQMSQEIDHSYFPLRTLNCKKKRNTCFKTDVKHCKYWWCQNSKLMF